MRRLSTEALRLDMGPRGNGADPGAEGQCHQTDTAPAIVVASECPDPRLRCIAAVRNKSVRSAKRTRPLP